MTWKRLGSQIVAQASDAEVMLADLQLGVYYTIGGSGAQMWDAIDRGCSREQIIRRLESIYEASPQILSDALTEFVDNLVDFDLVKPSGALLESQDMPACSPDQKRRFEVPVVSRFKRSDPLFLGKCKAIRWQPASAQVAWKHHDRAVSVVQVDQRVLYNLAGTAKDIWLGLCLGYTRQALIDELSQRFTPSINQIACDLDEFIADLVKHGLVQPADSEPNQLLSLPPSDASEWEAPMMVGTQDRDAALRWISTFNGWEPAAPRIVAELIEDEVVIVDLKAGTYNSISGAGTTVWLGLSAGQLGKDLVSGLQDCFEISADEAQAEVDLVVSQLVEYALIRPRNGDQCKQSAATLPTSAQKKPFERSQIVSYRDMEDVLRLDPVHDFDEYGWPNKALPPA